MQERRILGFPILNEDGIVVQPGEIVRSVFRVWTVLENQERPLGIVESEPNSVEAVLIVLMLSFHFQSHVFFVEREGPLKTAYSNGGRPELHTSRHFVSSKVVNGSDSRGLRGGHTVLTRISRRTGHAYIVSSRLQLSRFGAVTDLTCCERARRLGVCRLNQNL